MTGNRYKKLERPKSTRKAMSRDRRIVWPCVRKVHGESKIINKRDSDPLRCDCPDLIRVSGTAGENLQDVPIGLDAAGEI